MHGACPANAAIAKTAAAQLVDIESRLAPFFPQVATVIVLLRQRRPTVKSVTPARTPPPALIRLPAASSPVAQRGSGVA